MSSPTLIDTAAAVEALGMSQADIDALDEVSLRGGMRLVREHEQHLQRYKVWLAASIARRSDHTLGYAGLARKNGFPTPAAFIQSMSGTSMDEATKLARLGELVVEADTAFPASPDEHGGAAIATAATSGEISVDAADAIRRGLGRPDAAVTHEQLRVAAEKLIAHATSGTLESGKYGLGPVAPEALLKLARQARNTLDSEAIARGEKERAEARYVRLWEKDGFYGGSWKLTGEDGGAEVNIALKMLLAKRNGGPRFPETTSNGDPIAETLADTALEDTRSMDQVLADGFTQIFHNGVTADPTVIPGVGRAAVRVIVEQRVLAADPIDRNGSAILEDSLAPITFAKLEEYLCDGGTVGILFKDDGTIDVGREQRLFTVRQRVALAVRDGGCRFPRCTKPVSWTEAHHIEQWARDHGATTIENGILLCRYHHMLLHNAGWKIIRRDGTHWLMPPRAVDPDRTPIAMPSKNPLITTLRHAPPG